jgi:altronate dehydratase
LVVSVRDNVATALEPLAVGQALEVDGHRLVVRDAVPAGHKIAIAAIASGSPVIKYGSAIGTATTDIGPGTHVHTHNVGSCRGRGDLVAAAESRSQSAAEITEHGQPRRRGDAEESN